LRTFRVVSASFGGARKMLWANSRALRAAIDFSTRKKKVVVASGTDFEYSQFSLKEEN
jgi:hypothetical protein